MANGGRTTAEELRRTSGGRCPSTWFRRSSSSSRPCRSPRTARSTARPCPRPRPLGRRRTSSRADAQARPARTQTEKALAAIWTELLNLENIGIHDDFFDLGGHSCRPSGRWPKRRRSSACRCRRRRSSRRRPSRSSARSSAGRSTPTWSSLVPIQTAGTRQPFFLVHAIGGNVYNYRLLSKHLGADQPFYGIQARGINGKDLPRNRGGDGGGLHSRDARDVQPRSGRLSTRRRVLRRVIAFEMAQQLIAMGERVSVLVMLDTVRPGAPPQRIVEALADLGAAA